LAAAVSQQKSYFGRNQPRQTVAFLQSGRPIKSFACVCGCVKFNQVEMLFGQLSRCAKCVRTELQNLAETIIISATSSTRAAASKGAFLIS
jgi:hypothetical protein